MQGTQIEFTIPPEIFKLLTNLQSQFTNLNVKVDALEDNAKSSFKGIGNSLKQLNLNSITDSFEKFRDTLSDLNAPGMAFESQLADMSAIAGVVGKDLKAVGDRARQNAKIFGGDASKSVETYKLLLSQLSPELAKYPEIMANMADSSSILSKTMNNDTTAAVELLTTAMNQYKVSMDDPTAAQQTFNQFMNAMAAGAKLGSAELPALGSAIQAVGGDAKSSGLRFEEMVSSLQFLDKVGKKASEGGTALRNTLASLNQGRFLPKDVQKELQGAGIDLSLLSDKSIKFTDRLRALKPIQSDAALLSKLFGKENKLAAQALIESVDAQDKMTAAITGTNTANEQAAIIMDTKAEKLSRLNAFFDDAKITVSGATGSLLPYTEATFGALKAVSSVVPAMNALRQAVNFLNIAEKRAIITKKLSATVTKVVTAAQWAWNVALTANPIGLLVVGIAAMVAVVGVIITKYDEWGAAMALLLGPFGTAITIIQSFRQHWESVKESFTTGGILAGIKRIGIVLLDAVLMPVQQLLEMLAKVPGLGSLAEMGADKIKGIRENLDLLPKELTIKTINDSGITKPEGYSGLPFGESPNSPSPGKAPKSMKQGFARTENKTYSIQTQALIKEFIIKKAETGTDGSIKESAKNELMNALNDIEAAK